jgi:dolichol-phosphate mannosyltransferase
MLKQHQLDDSDRQIGPGNLSLSIVVPVYNNSASLSELHSRLLTTLSDIGLPSFELIFIDDGSVDDSRMVAKKLCDVDPRVKMIALSRNFGHQLAITAGFDATSGEAVVVMDADLQDPPEVIPQFVEKWREGFDVVHGVRRHRAGESLFKVWTAALFYRVLRMLTRTHIIVDSGDFRLMSRRAMDAFNGLRERARFVRGMVSWLGYPQAMVYYDRVARRSGDSQYSFQKMMKLALDGLVAFSDVPLRIASWIGFGGVVFCLVYFMYVIFNKFMFGIPVEGWTSLAATVLFIGSVQLMILGVMGHYVGRIYEELKGRPLYVVQERVGFDRPMRITS